MHIKIITHFTGFPAGSTLSASCCGTFSVTHVSALPRSSGLSDNNNELLPNAYLHGVDHRAPVERRRLYKTDEAPLEQRAVWRSLWAGAMASSLASRSTVGNERERRPWYCASLRRVRSVREDRTAPLCLFQNRHTPEATICGWMFE